MKKKHSYSSYRYGTQRKSKVYQPGKALPVVDADKRRALVQKVGAVLNTFTFSKFEFEAACRHGLRQGWCLDGHGWDAADETAKAIVAQALSTIGAVRPTWEQGQPEYAAPTDSCLQCSGPLDDESIGRQAKFCSRECAAGFMASRGQSRESQQRHVIQVAKRMVVVGRREQRKCECCGKGYQAQTWDDQAAGSQKFCSRECRDQSRRTIPERCCEVCGTKFRPGHLKQPGRFCSNTCRGKAEKTETSAECAYCGDYFKTPTIGRRAIYCSDMCGQADRRLAKGVMPSVLPPHVFDHFVTKPINASRPAWLSIERFDQMVAA